VFLAADIMLSDARSLDMCNMLYFGGKRQLGEKDEGI
jgi:hypothetical protein